MRHLPIELYCEIVQHLGLNQNNVLLPLLLTSKAFNAAAERQLYRSVIGHPSLFDQHAFFKRVASDERVAGYVRQLHIGSTPGNISEAMLAVFWEDCFRALRVLQNLQELSFSEEPYSFAPFESYTYPFQLQVFLWDVPKCQPPLLSFLARQPNLRRLEFTWCLNKITLGDAEELLVTSLSNIRILRGPQELVVPLLRGGTTTDLHIKNLGREPLALSLRPTLRSTESIKTLSIDDNRYYMPLLHEPNLLPNVVSLHLTSPSVLDLEAACRLPKLACLTLLRRPYGRDILPWSERNLNRVVSELFRRSKSLHLVEIESHMEARFMLRWSRDSPRPSSSSLGLVGDSVV